MRDIFQGSAQALVVLLPGNRRLATDWFGQRLVENHKNARGFLQLNCCSMELKLLAVVHNDVGGDWLPPELPDRTSAPDDW
jgi:hypothetical protein